MPESVDGGHVGHPDRVLQEVCEGAAVDELGAKCRSPTGVGSVSPAGDRPLLPEDASEEGPEEQAPGCVPVCSGALVG